MYHHLHESSKPAKLIENGNRRLGEFTVLYLQFRVPFFSNPVYKERKVFFNKIMKTMR